MIVNSWLYLFKVVDPGAFSWSNIFGSFNVKLYNPRDPSKVEIVISYFIYSVCIPARPTLINTACTLFMCLQWCHCTCTTNPTGAGSRWRGSRERQQQQWKSKEGWLGFNMGIPRVRFSHTVPVLYHTVPAIPNHKTGGVLWNPRYLWYPQFLFIKIL